MKFRPAMNMKPKVNQVKHRGVLKGTKAAFKGLVKAQTSASQMRRHRIRLLLLWAFSLEIRLNLTFPSLQAEFVGWHVILTWPYRWRFDAGINRLPTGFVGFYVTVPAIYIGWRTPW